MKQGESEHPVSGGEQASEPVASTRTFVSGRLLICAVCVIALAAGYYGGRFARGRFGNAAADVRTTVAKSDKEADKNSPPAPVLKLDPDAPVPDKAEPLTREVKAVVDCLVATFPESPDALEVQARSEVWLGNSSKAFDVWKKCVKLDPRYVYAYVGLASVAAERAEHDQAVEYAKQALEVEPNNFQARVTLTQSLLQLGRAAEVPPVLEPFLKSDPRSQGFYLLGQAYSQLEQYEKAKDSYEAAIRIFPDYVEAYNGLAVAYEHLGQPDKAKPAMEKFQKLNAPEKSAARIRGSTVSDLKLMQEGAAALYADAGSLFFTSGRKADAETVWVRAAALDSHNVLCRQSLAWLMRNAARYGENIAWLNQLAAIDPTNPSYLIEVGRTYEKLKLLPAAEESFRKACKAAPANDAGYVALAGLLLRYGQNLAETATLARKAIEIRPSAANYALLASACRANGDLPAARTALEQAIKLAPQDPSYKAALDAINAGPAKK
jgi:tetratricopeptide (TPR) repeat protein